MKLKTYGRGWLLLSILLMQAALAVYSVPNGSQPAGNTNYKIFAMDSSGDNSVVLGGQFYNEELERF